MPHKAQVSRLALFLSLFALASSKVHMAVVKHDRCLEHGELVEVSGIVVEHAAGPTAAWYADASGERHDDHCPLLSPSSVPFAFHAESVALDLIGALPRPEPAVMLIAHTSVDSLDIAPKQGPPRLEG